MNESISCDICIIGSGSGGLSLAAGASQFGAKVVLVESGKMGGDCLNTGCIPSKSLLSAAKSFYNAKHKNYFKAEITSTEVDFKKVMQHVHEVIKTIAVNDSVARFESLGVNVILARAQFLDKNTVQAGDTIIHAKYIVIATGSSPFIPPIPGLSNIPFETNESIFNLETLPKHLIVIGGGPIGCELAQAFCMLGTQVTILEVFQILPKDDADCVAIVRDELKSMGVNIYENIKVTKVEKINDHGNIVVAIEENGQSHLIEGTHLLVSTGRTPNVKNLKLEDADVKYSPKKIEVDARLRTSNKKIYAIGDVIGSFQFTHVANYHAGVVLRNILFRLPAKVDYHAVPWVTYTDPEIAHVGITASDIKDKTDTQITEFSFAKNDRAQTNETIIGKIKVITNKKSRILGVTIVCADAGELIFPWIIAINEKKTLRSFTNAIAPYPTLSEVSKRVAGEFYIPIIFSKKIRWVVKLLLKLG